MKSEHNYIAINKQSWNNKVAAHLKSDFYDVAGFLKGNTSLNKIELKLLGNVKEKSILHLQCHFGQDSLSFARLGAKVTGVDFSDKAIETAQYLATKTEQDTSFICCDIYDLPKHSDQQFDIVYTSYGTIGWLPDIDKWAQLVSQYVKPNGKFVFVDFHPVVWMFDDDFKHIKYNYFNSDAIIETENGTYADRNAPLENQSITWNHGLGEVVNSLLKNGLEIKALNEYDYSPYNCFNETKKIDTNKFRIKHLGNTIPMVYAIVTTKKTV